MYEENIVGLRGNAYHSILRKTAHVYCILSEAQGAWADINFIFTLTQKTAMGVSNCLQTYFNGEEAISLQ